MNIKINKIYFIIPVIYTAVIIFLLYMQFSGSNQFSAQVYDISMSGKTKAGAPGREDQITDLLINCSGVNFVFDEDNPLIVFSQDGLTHNTVPVDYRVTSSGIDINLSKEISLSFFYEGSRTDIINISVTAGDPESIKYIHIPISSPDSQISLMQGVPVISIVSESNQNFFITMPDSGNFYPGKNIIELYPESAGTSLLSLEQAAASGIDAFTYWKSGNSELISDADLKIRINDFIDRSFDSLMNSRFNSTRGTWTAGAGVSEFTEAALIMAAAESISTSDYPIVKELLDRAAASHSRSIGKLSSAIFGNMVNSVWKYDQLMLEKPGRLAKKIQSQDITVFSDPDLTASVLTGFSNEDINALIDFVNGLEVSALSLNDALDIASAAADLREEYPWLANQFESIPSIIENGILSSITILADSLMLSEDKQTAEVYTTLKAGTLLQKYPDYAAVGRELVNIILSLADEDGVLPQSVQLGSDDELEYKGRIYPEEIYPLITDNTYYPEENFFIEETGESISVLNQADDFRLEKTQTGYRMSFNFPAGETHVFAVRNFAPFYEMNMLGYKWNSDHRFLTYSSGWWHDKQHNTLFVKIKHRQKNEQIIITSERPAVTQPAAEAEPQNSSAESMNTNSSAVQ